MCENAGYRAVEPEALKNLRARLERILAVSENPDEIQRFHEVLYRRQGYMVFYPGIKQPVEVNSFEDLDKAIDYGWELRGPGNELLYKSETEEDHFVKILEKSG